MGNLLRHPEDQEDVEFMPGCPDFRDPMSPRLQRPGAPAGTSWGGCILDSGRDGEGEGGSTRWGGNLIPESVGAQRILTLGNRSQPLSVGVSTHLPQFWC